MGESYCRAKTTRVKYRIRGLTARDSRAVPPTGNQRKGIENGRPEASRVEEADDQDGNSDLLAESTELTKQQVACVFDELAKLIAANLSVEGPGVFTVPGMMKISVVRKPATEARTGINPFTKEETVFKAKPRETWSRSRHSKG